MRDKDIPKGTVVHSHLYMKREDAVAFLAELILKVYPEMHKEDAIRLIAEKMTPKKYPGISDEAAKRLFAKTFDKED